MDQQTATRRSRPSGSFDGRKFIRSLRLRDGDDCQLCPEPINWKRWELRWNRLGQVPGDPSVDHIVPVSLGGAVRNLANMRIAHRSCNEARGNGST